jgi:hypothetical protein
MCAPKKKVITVIARLYQNSDKQGGGLADLIVAADLNKVRGGMSGQNTINSATEMLQDIHIKLTDPASSDCTIVCNGKRFPSHKYILCLRSNVFKVCCVSLKISETDMRPGFH